MTDNLLDLHGRVALVTGAGQGIGREIALTLGDQGAAGVIVNDLRLERCGAVVDELRSRGVSASAIAADITDHDAVETMVAEATHHFGRVDVLVNNAGNMGANDPDPMAMVPFWESTPADWRPWIDVNLHGVMLCARAVLPGMVERGTGRVITIISEAGRLGEAGMESYSAGKAGAAGFSRALARSTARFGITVNCVAIGATRTPTVAAFLDDENLGGRIRRAYPLGRFGEPADVAAMVLFLASEAGSWITGQTYPVNGGFSFAL